MQAKERLTQAVIKILRKAVTDAGGNEIFALGHLDEAGMVHEVEVLSRGHKTAVLAIKDGQTADVLIHNHPSGLLTPSDNDLAIASRASEDGTGSFIINNEAQEVYVVVEPTRKRQHVRLQSDVICASLEEGGAVANRLESYEVRPSQLDLMRLVIRGFNEDALVAAEAGTGVGKSFAYLLPAVEYALANDERIVISTATINLQQQLYEKDIPLVVSALNREIKAVLVKGRGNYVCRRRLYDAVREPDLMDDDFEQLKSIVSWAETTKNGSRSDLSFLPPENVWSRVCSEADICMGMRCPERERCFVLAVRKECADARILVVNHHLLFADLAARSEGAGYDNTVVLPPYNRVILDEAHTIENAGTSFFSEGFNRLGLFRQAGRLYRRRRRGPPAGLLLRLIDLIFHGAAGEAPLNNAAAQIEKIREIADSLDQAALQLCGSEGVFRLTPSRKDSASAILFPNLRELRSNIGAFVQSARDILEQVPEDVEDENAVWEIKAVLRRFETIADVCATFLEFGAHSDKVVWIERHTGQSGGDWADFSVTPLDVSAPLGEALFKPNKTVVCVSATLTVADSSSPSSFAYWNSRSGIRSVSGRKVFTGNFPSPFPYNKSVLLAVPSDAPLPDQREYGSYVDDAVTRLVENSGGSALVLFTSYSGLRSAYSKAAPVLEKQGIRCLKQGDDDRARLLQNFLKDESSVLFATDSFWEGVDAPGDTLRLVILCRLPFKTPNDPVFEARCEAVEQKGANAFMELSVPESVMKFKQGFGRLMRRSSDHGVVAVLDARLLHKRYGALFINSLPQTRTSFKPFTSLLQDMEQFLFAAR
ncbi:helicase [Spirochaetia bacterium]|nr:helicase [Spirochaetia bacterium]